MYMDLSKLLHGFVKVVLYFFRPLPNKTKISKPVEASVLNYRVLNESKYLMPKVMIKQNLRDGLESATFLRNLPSHLR